MSATWQWAKANPDAAALHIRELERENAALRGLLQDSLEWLDDYGMRMSGTNDLVSRIEKALNE